MRLSGLASGMDTDMMVKEMMKAERMKVDRVEQKKQIALWRQESYNNMNKLLANFILNSRKELGLNKTSSTGLITTNSYKNLDYVKKASSSKETVATITSTSSGTINGSFEIEVEKLAKQDRVSMKMGKDDEFETDIVINGVKIESNGKTAKEVSKLINNNKDLKEQNAGAFYDDLTGRLFINADHNGGDGIKISGMGNSSPIVTMTGLNTNGLDGNTKLVGPIKVNGIEILPNGGSVDELIDGINNNPDLKGIKASLEDGQIKFETNIESFTGLTNENLTMETELTGPIEINGVELLKDGGTVKQLIAEINKEIPGLKASLKDGKIEFEPDVKFEGLDLEAGRLGEKTKLQGPIEINGQEFLKNGGTVKDLLNEINNSDLGLHASLKDGKIEFVSLDDSNLLAMDKEKGNFAEIYINGVKVEEKDINSNTIEFNGMKIELNSENRYELDADGNKIKDKLIERASTTIKVESNVDGMMEKIQKFVEDYNAMMDAIALSTSEKRYQKYHPLSQEEKKAMTEADVKLWEEKAKSGMLNRDESLNRMTQNIRLDLYKKVEGFDGVYKSIVDIGITTEKYAKGAAGGKLQIDEKKLRAALEENPEDVMEMLFADDKSAKPSKVDKPKDLGENPTAEQQAKYEADMKKYEDYEKAMDKYRAENTSTSMRKGIFTSIFDNMTDGMKDMIEKSGTGDSADLYRNVKSNILLDFVTKKSSISDLDKELKEMERKIDNLNILLDKKENSYYARFTAMEKYIHQMSSQSAWIGQQMM